MPSRRHFLQTGSVVRPMGQISLMSPIISLDAALLRGAAAVVRERGDVFDRLDDQSGLLQGSHRGLAAGAGALELDLDLLQAELRGLAGGLLRGALGGEGRALAAALEANGAGRGVTQRVALRVGDRHDRVVERRLNVRDPAGHIATLLAFLALGHVLPHLLHALLARDGLAGALAGAGVGLGSLAAHRQAAAMAHAAVATDVFQPFDILLRLPLQRALDDEVLLVEETRDAGEVLVRHLAGLALWVDAGHLAQLTRSRRSDADKVAQRDVGRFVRRNVHAHQTGHCSSLLALPLLVARVAANDVHGALSAHQLAVFADALDARSNLHDALPGRSSYRLWELFSLCAAVKQARGLG